jgi:hypothetical protein
MSEKSGVRQALLKSQFAHLYPGVVSNEWQAAGAMLDQVNAIPQHRTSTSRRLRTCWILSISHCVAQSRPVPNRWLVR